MIIPSKHSGYQAGIRLYPGGATGGGSGLAQPMTGEDYNRRLQAGETSEAIRNSTKGLFGPGMSDANWGAVVQNAGMTSPTGRPMAGSDQFYQPIYQPQYNNYANPLTAGSVAAYGTNPGPSSGYLAATAQGGQGLDSYYQGLRNFGAQQSSQPYGMDYATFNPARKALGANQADLMNAYQYNPQQQFGGGFGGGFMPQMQAPFNPYTNQYQSPFSYQQPQQPRQQYNPYQMQSPFSYQQPFSGGYGGGNFIPDAPLPEGMMGTMGGTGFDPMTGRMDLGTAGGSGQYTPAPPRSSGPSQAIVGRSAQMRGTPNVMRRAEGGIASLVDDVE